MAVNSGAISIEIIHEQIERGRVRFALFDFDGTISLIRQGWQEVMIRLLTEWLVECAQTQDRQAIEQLVTEYVARSTGLATVFQMIWVAEQVNRRGGNALDPIAYKEIYTSQLNARIRRRLEVLASDRAQPQEHMVPGAQQVLENLRQRGCTVYCASGTDHPYVVAEAELLGVSTFFNGGIFGATNDYENFSKKILIQKIIANHHLSGPELLTFGDGYVEIEDTRAAGGIAVGVASDEVHRSGVDAVKRSRLIEAGADVIIPDFREQTALLAWLFDVN